MAFLSTNSNIRNSILAFIKRIVSKRIYKAIEIILHPCCTNTVTVVDFSCGDPGEYDVTITFTGTTNLFEHGFGILYVDGVPVSVQGVYNDNGSITFTGVALTATVEYSFNVLMHMATNNSEFTQGVYITATAIDATPPVC